MRQVNEVIITKILIMVLIKTLSSAPISPDSSELTIPDIQSGSVTQEVISSNQQLTQAQYAQDNVTLGQKTTPSQGVVTVTEAGLLQEVAGHTLLPGGVSEDRNDGKTNLVTTEKSVINDDISNTPDVSMSDEMGVGNVTNGQLINGNSPNNLTHNKKSTLISGSINDTDLLNISEGTIEYNNLEGSTTAEYVSPSQIKRDSVHTGLDFSGAFPESKQEGASHIIINEQETHVSSEENTFQSSAAQSIIHISTDSVENIRITGEKASLITRSLSSAPTQNTEQASQLVTRLDNLREAQEVTTGAFVQNMVKPQNLEVPRDILTDSVRLKPGDTQGNTTQSSTFVDQDKNITHNDTFPPDFKDKESPDKKTKSIGPTWTSGQLALGAFIGIFLVGMTLALFINVLWRKRSYYNNPAHILHLQDFKKFQR